MTEDVLQAGTPSSDTEAKRRTRSPTVLPTPALSGAVVGISDDDIAERSKRGPYADLVALGMQLQPDSGQNAIRVEVPAEFRDQGDKETHKLFLQFKSRVVSGVCRPLRDKRESENLEFSAERDSSTPDAILVVCRRREE